MGFLLESERQQVCSGLLDSPEYFNNAVVCILSIGLTVTEIEAQK